MCQNHLLTLKFCKMVTYTQIQVHIEQERVDLNTATITLTTCNLPAVSIFPSGVAKQVGK